MRVLVKWIRSPRQKYGIPRSSGVSSYIDEKLAKQIEKESPGFIEILEKERPVRVKDTQVRKPRTRPVKREKEG